jgi:hypothetical protein
VLVNHSRAFLKKIKNRKQIKETGGGKKKLKKKNQFTVITKKNQRSCKYIKILFKIFLS